MVTGELKGKIDRVWEAFWSGGISNPLEVIEQITYLLFIRRLDDLETLAEKRFRRGLPVERWIFPKGNDPEGRPYEELRWSRFKNLDPGQYKVYAWREVESGAYMDSEFVGPVESRGQALTIHEGSQENLQLKLIG